MGHGQQAKCSQRSGCYTEKSANCDDDNGICTKDTPATHVVYCSCKDGFGCTSAACSQCTISPTAAPSTAVPSIAPTQGPTATPTTEPSTAVPSTTPSQSPTGMPSTSVPSLGPSVGPSAAPSASPSGAPTTAPSVAPSGTPTSSVRVHIHFSFYHVTEYLIIKMIF